MTTLTVCTHTHTCQLLGQGCGRSQLPSCQPHPQKVCQRSVHPVQQWRVIFLTHWSYKTHLRRRCASFVLYVCVCAHAQTTLSCLVPIHGLAKKAFFHAMVPLLMIALYSSWAHYVPMGLLCESVKNDFGYIYLGGGKASVPVL